MSKFINRSAKRDAVIPGSRWVWIAASLLTAACALPAAAAVKMSPGQEFLYSGAAEWNYSGPGRPRQTLGGRVSLSAAVIDADPARGYTVVLMRHFQPGVRPGPRAIPPEAEVVTLRYGPDLAPAPARRLPPPGGPISGAMAALAVPLTPRADLTPGQQWRRSEFQPIIVPRPLELAYTVVGRTDSGGRPCLSVERRPAERLPIRLAPGAGSRALEDYQGTLCVDPATGQVLADQWRARMRFETSRGPVTVELVAAVALGRVQQLSPQERAGRVRQAQALDRLRQMALPRRGADRLKSLQEAAGALAAFRRQFPHSPYAPALAPIERYVTVMRTRARLAARARSLPGRPAPAFRLKDLDGQEQTLGAYRGKLVLLNFFASW